MRIFKFMFLLLFVNMAAAQNYFGFLSDNYSGINSATLNPANITGSKFRTEINLGSANGSINNDYFVTDFGNIFDGSDIDTDQFIAAENNNFAISSDVLLPSFMFNLSPKHSIGIILRARAYLNINEIKDSANYYISYFKGLINDDYGFKKLNFKYSPFFLVSSSL